MNNAKLYKQRLSELVALPSVSCTQPDLDMSNEGVINCLSNWLENLGFSCKVLPVEGFQGKYNLVATLGKGTGGLVLSGHTDTVPCNPDRWQQDPFKLVEKDDKLYGLGSTDMKGFFPVVLAAVEALHEVSALENIKHPLIVLATADEESSMSGARALTESDLNQSRYAVVGEPTELTPIRMHKGIMMEKINIQGTAGHSSNPDLGASALEAMHEVMSGLIDFRKDIGIRYSDANFEISVPTLNLGCIHGGDNPNRICGHCELEFDLRPLPGMNIDDLREEISSLVQPIAERSGTHIHVEKLFPGIPAYSQDKHSDLVSTAETLTGNPSESVAFATEAPFLKNLGMQTIVLGPGSINQAHQPDEFISLDQIGPAVDIVQKLIQRYCLGH